MARPRKQGIDYFPLDVDFFSDEKVVCVSGEFGLKGEIALVKLLCAVYRNGYYVVWDDRMKATLLHQLPGVGADMLQQLVLRLVRWEIFDAALFESDSVLTSVGIQKRFFEVARKRAAPTADYPYLLVEPQNYALRRLNFRVENSKKIVSESKTTVYASEIPPQEVPESVNIIENGGGQKSEKSVFESKMTVSDAETQGFRNKSTQSKVKNIIIKENNKAKKRNQEEDFASASAEANERIEQEARILKEDTSWSEVVCMKYGIMPDELKERVDEFAIHCKTRAARHLNPDEAKRHFCSWLDLRRKDEGTENITQPRARTASRIRTAII
jgi:hypothetical protein